MKLENFGIFEVKIEISKNSKIKYEFNKNTNSLYVDRILFGSNIYPQNYGYLENTLGYDKDPLDVVVISNESLIPGCMVAVRILGALEMIDDGEKDEKLIGVIEPDPRYKNIRKLSDISKGLLDEIKDFFKNYKNLENKKVEIRDFIGWKDAKKIIEEGKELFQKSLR